MTEPDAILTPEVITIGTPARVDDPGILPRVTVATTAAGGLDPGAILDAALAGRNPRTLRAYLKAYRDLARWSGADVRAALGSLLADGPGRCNAVLLAYRAHLGGRGLAPATVANRLCALRYYLRVAKTLGRIDWAPEVPGPRVVSYRDTRGPGLDGWKRLWAAAVRAGDRPAARRDRALLRLLHDRGLRRGECCGLDREDFDADPESPAVAVLGKGQLQKQRLTLNAPTRAALLEWIAARGDWDGPLFVGLDTCRGRGRSRLDGRSVARILARLSRAAGLARPCRPHGLRHQAITRALDLTGGDVRKTQVFSRHKTVETVMRYDDARRDEGGSITRLLGEDAE